MSVVTTRIVVPTLGKDDKSASSAIKAVTESIYNANELGFHIKLEIHDVSPTETSYYYSLESLWLQQDSFITVERDIIINPLTIISFLTCNNEWCAAPYPYMGMTAYPGLGAMKFNTELIKRHAPMWEWIGKLSDTNHTPRHWCTLDAHLQGYLTGRGENLCINHETVEHLSVKPSHGCVLGWQ